MALRVEINPELLIWAIERSGMDGVTLRNRFTNLESWLDGSVKPTLRQVEAFAKATHTPSGFLFLPTPPQEKIPIPDYRTMSGSQAVRPSANLLETINLCRQRQDWYREYARGHGVKKPDFVGGADTGMPVERVASDIRGKLNFDLNARRSMKTWEEALRSFIACAENIGIMVMRNGVVLNNTRRKLNPEEFRGFALTDDIAPLVFINGADTLSAQMFTLAHELAHIWLGETALSNADVSFSGGREIERWCNSVAAELLVPKRLFENELFEEPLPEAISRLTRYFKVSSLVILRRMRDVKYLTQENYDIAYGEELERLSALDRKPGGNFYLSQPYKLSARFSAALIVSTLEGQTLFRDAMRMLGMKKVSTFNKLRESLEVKV